MAQKFSQYFKYTIDGKEYQIRYKTLTVGDQVRIGQQYAALKGGFNQLDKTSDDLAYIVAHLSTAIIDKPEELNFDNIEYDDWKTLNQMFNDFKDFAFFRKENSGG